MGAIAHRNDSHAERILLIGKTVAGVYVEVLVDADGKVVVVNG